MNTKTKLLAAFVLIGLAGLTFNGCKKSNEKLIVGTWKVTKVMQGVTDVTSEWIKGPYIETYASGGVYSYTGQPKGNGQFDVGSGKYTWDGKTTFKRNGVSSQSSVTCTVKILDKSNLEFTYSDGSVIWDYTFVKQ